MVIDGGYEYGIRIVEGPDDWQPYWPTGNYKVAILVKNASRVIFRHILFDFADNPLPEENPNLKIGIYDWLNDTTDLTVERCRFSKGHMAVRGTGREPYHILDSVFVGFTTTNAFSMGTFGGIIDLPYSDIGTIARNAFLTCTNTTAFNHMVQFRGTYEIHDDVDGMDLFLYAAQGDFTALASFAGEYGLVDLFP